MDSRDTGAAAAETAVRRAGPADAGAIAVISVQGWQAAYRAIMPDEFLAGLSVGAREKAWRARLEADEDQAPAWIASRAERAVGFLCGGPPRDGDAPDSAVEVYAIYVLPEAWRGGVGRSLLETALEHWRSRGVETALLWVLEANAPARRFYEALGWRLDGARQEVDLGGFAPPEVRYRRSIGA